MNVAENDAPRSDAATEAADLPPVEPGWTVLFDAGKPPPAPQPTKVTIRVRREDEK